MQEIGALKGKYLMHPSRKSDGKKCCLVLGSQNFDTRGYCGWEAVGAELRRHGHMIKGEGAARNSAAQVMQSLAEFLQNADKTVIKILASWWKSFKPEGYKNDEFDLQLYTSDLKNRMPRLKKEKWMCSFDLYAVALWVESKYQNLQVARYSTQNGEYLLYDPRQTNKFVSYCKPEDVDHNLCIIVCCSGKHYQSVEERWVTCLNNTNFPSVA